MGLFFCPKLRNYRGASGSSDGASAYDLGQTEHPEGLSPSTDEHPSGRRTGSSGGLSSRLRRRFSRDAKDLNIQPKRGPELPFLQPSKQPAVRTSPVAHDFGGSLMSEGGYDSDAQYITTPKPSVYAREHPASRPTPGMLMLAPRPSAPPSKPDLEPLQGQKLDLTVGSKDLATEQSPCHATQGKPRLSPPCRNHEHPHVPVPQRSPSSFQNVDLGSLRGESASSCPDTSRDPAQQQQPAPDAVPLKVQETLRSQTLTVSLEDGTNRYSGQGIDTRVTVYSTRRVPLQQEQGYTTSADSVAGCPPQLSVRKRHQRPRKEITQGEQSIHLGEMNIRRILASSGSTPRLEPQDRLYNENRTSGNTGTWNSSRYPNNNPIAMPPIFDAPEVRSPSMVPASIQGPRSPYSLKSTVSSADLDEQNIANFGRGSSSNTPSRRPYLSSDQASASACAEIEANALKSKFIERFGSDRSVGAAGVEPSDDDNSNPSRRISIGWMTEGRRIGYGYELVPPDNSTENHVETFCGPALAEERGVFKNSLKEPLAGNVAEDIKKQKPSLAEEASQPPPKTRDSSFDISAIFQKFNLQRWAGTNFALRTSNNSDAASCDSGGSSLFGILTNKKKPIGEAGPNADAADPWEFCSWVRPIQSSGGQQAPQQGTVQSRDDTEAQLINKLATFRRRRGTLATKRKVSEIARNLEKRADQAVDKLPGVRRTATRVLRLRESGRKEWRRGMHVNDPAFPATQLDGLSDGQVKLSEGSNSGSSNWDSLYEECLDSLEECSIPE